jgi:hypothetical protein
MQETPLFPSFMGFFLLRSIPIFFNLPYENIVFNDKVCLLLLKFFKDHSSGCRCSIAFLKI